MDDVDGVEDEGQDHGGKKRSGKQLEKAHLVLGVTIRIALFQCLKDPFSFVRSSPGMESWQIFIIALGEW